MITTIGAVVALLIASWTMFSHFDKRNQDRFDGLQRQIDGLKLDFQALKLDVQKQLEGLKELLRAEMREMRAEIKLEIKEAGDRRVIGR